MKDFRHSGSAQAAPKPPVNRDRLAADLFVQLAAKFAIKQPSAGETGELVRLSYTYADAFLTAMEARS